jgi:hypothetical protein
MPQEITFAPGQPVEINASSSAANSVFDRAVCLSVELQKPSISRRGNLAEVTTTADKGLLRLSKTILDSAEYALIQNHDNKIRRAIKAIAVESPLRAGTYLVPHALIVDLDDQLQALYDERLVLIERFIDSYPTRIEESRERLKDQFNPSDYPAAGELRAAFGVRQQWFSFGVPGQLANISPEIARRAQEQAEERWMEASNEIQEALRIAMRELVSHLASRLAPSPEGKRQTFKATTLDRVQEFLRTFHDRNLTDDSQLAALVEQAQNVIAGVGVDRLRSDELLRGEVQQRFTEITAALDGMIGDAPRRALFLDDEPASEPAANQVAEPAAA